MVSEKKRASNDRWDRENMTVLGCRVRREYAEQVREKAAEQGVSVNAVIRSALDKFLETGLEPEPGEGEAEL